MESENIRPGEGTAWGVAGVLAAVGLTGAVVDDAKQGLQRCTGLVMAERDGGG